jgi:hypothetical protein
MRIVAIAAIIGTALAGAAQAANLIVNPGFEAGNTGFTSGYTHSPGGLGPAGVYAVINNPNSLHGAFSPVPPHGGTLQMVINGADVANVLVWGEDDLAVLPDTQYFFSAFVTSVHPAAPAQLNFSVNGVQLGATFAAGAVGDQLQYFATWFSGAATQADLALVNQNTAFSGNDFALDDLAFDTVAPTSGTPVGGTRDPNPGQVPEPAGMLVLGVALAGLRLVRRRR